MTIEPGKEVECLLESLKAHFRSKVGPKSSAQLAAQRAELLRNLPAGTQVDETLLSVATGLQMVENISLLSNAKDNNFIGVNMYVDDEGAVRNAPRNLRASEIAHCCGQPLDVRGDAFLARVLDDGEDFQRLDLDVGEVSSSATWVKAAAEQQAKRKHTSGIDVLQRLQSGDARAGQLRELSPAEAKKEDGNQAFKRGDYDQAVSLYTQAIDLDRDLILAVNNRAMAYLKTEEWEKALSDCESVLAREPKNVKALLRAARAAMGLGLLDTARSRLDHVLSIEPNNKEATQLLCDIF